jgi:tetratricopeptide (TPR) repeat protein
MIRAASALVLLAFLLLPSVAPAVAQDAGPLLEEMFALVRDGKIDDALARGEAYRVDHPDDPAVHHGLGRIHFLKGNMEEAVAFLDRCLALEPTEGWMVAWSHAVLGQAHAALGHREPAEKHLRRAIELDATSNCTREARRALAVLTGEDPWGKGPLVGKELPEFEFRGITGETYRPADFRGQGVLFKFGPSW